MAFEVTRAVVALLTALLLLPGASRAWAAAPAEAPLPELTQPVNDFAHVIDASSAAAMDHVIRTLKAASGDVVVVATVQTVQPYAEIRELAVKMFENRGRGIGDKGKDNGLLILLALNERRVWIEVGYELEQWVTDGFAGETSRDYMVPEFRNGRYGAGLLAGTSRIAGRIAQGRNVQLTGVEIPRERRAPPGRQLSLSWIVLLFIIIVLISRMSGGPGSAIRRGGWSGWSSGVGPFGGGWGGGFGGGGGGFGGGGGGGFGGFGGGRSGGGGGGAGW